MARKKTKKTTAKSEVIEKMAALITGAFAFVAALVWKDAIMEWMKPILESGEGAVPLTVVAVIVTVIAVVATIWIGKVAQSK